MFLGWLDLHLSNRYHKYFIFRLDREQEQDILRWNSDHYEDNFVWKDVYCSFSIISTNGTNLQQTLIIGILFTTFKSYIKSRLLTQMIHFLWMDKRWLKWAERGNSLTRWSNQIKIPTGMRSSYHLNLINYSSTHMNCMIQENKSTKQKCKAKSKT